MNINKLRLEQRTQDIQQALTAISKRMKQAEQAEGEQAITLMEDLYDECDDLYHDLDDFRLDVFRMTKE